MANRVVLGAFDGTFVLRVSKPGYNVLSTSLTNEQLAFDSRWTEASNFVMDGEIVFTTASYIQVTFPVTFPSARLPQVLFWPRISTNAYDFGRYLVNETFSGSVGDATPTITVTTTYARFPKPNDAAVVGGTYIIVANQVV